MDNYQSKIDALDLFKKMIGDQYAETCENAICNEGDEKGAAIDGIYKCQSCEKTHVDEEIFFNMSENIENVSLEEIITEFHNDTNTSNEMKELFLNVTSETMLQENLSPEEMGNYFMKCLIENVNSKLPQDNVNTDGCTHDIEYNTLLEDMKEKTGYTYCVECNKFIDVS